MDEAPKERKKRGPPSSPRPRLQPHLLPQPIPLPNPAPNRWRNPIPQLMRQHQDLPTMVRLMRKHVSKHRPASRPHRNPTPSVELRYPPLRPTSQSIRQHAQTLLCTLLVCRRSLLQSAPIRIERRRTLQMRCRIPYPNQPAVMQMRKESSNSPPAPRLTGRRRPPSLWIKVGQQMLIHKVIDGVSLYQNRGKLCFRSAVCASTHPRSHRYHLTKCHPERSWRSQMRAATESKDPVYSALTSGLDRHSLDNCTGKSRTAVIAPTLSHPEPSHLPRR